MKKVFILLVLLSSVSARALECTTLMGGKKLVLEKYDPNMDITFIANQEYVFGSLTNTETEEKLLVSGIGEAYPEDYVLIDENGKTYTFKTKVTSTFSRVPCRTRVCNDFGSLSKNGTLTDSEGKSEFYSCSL